MSVRLEGFSLFDGGRCDVAFVGPSLVAVGKPFDHSTIVRLGPGDEPDKPAQEGPTDKTFSMVAPLGAAGAEAQRLAVISGNEVRELLYPSLSFERIIVRSTLPFRHLAVHPRGQWIAVGGDDTDVRLVDLRDTTRSLRLTGPTQAVKSLAFDPLGKVLACSSGDGMVRFWDVRQLAEDSMGPTPPSTLPSMPPLIGAPRKLLLEDRTDPDSNFLLARLAWHPTGRFLAIAGRREVLLCTVTPSNDPDAWPIISADRGSGVQHEDATHLIAWSPNGRYLASASMQNDAAVWDMRDYLTELLRSTPAPSSPSSSSSSSSSPVRVAQFECDCVLTAIAWNPTSGSLATVDEDGRLERPAPIHDEMASAVRAQDGWQPPLVKRSKVPDRPAASGSMEERKEANMRDRAEEESDDDDDDEEGDDDMPVGTSRRKLRRRSKRPAAMDRWRDDEAAEGDGDESEENDANGGRGAKQLTEEEQEDLARIKSQFGFGEDGAALAGDDNTNTNANANDDHELEEEAERRRRRDPLHAAMEVARMSRERERERMQMQSGAPTTPATMSHSIHTQGPVQPVVHPGASEPTRRDPRRRFLCWNLFAQVTSRDDEEYRTVEVEWHEGKSGSSGGAELGARPRSFRITDDDGITMAAAGEGGVIFAAPSSGNGEEEDDDALEDIPRGIRATSTPTTPATVSFLPFTRWAGEAMERWSVSLPNGEDPVAVAAGREWCAVATSTQLLRVFRSGGVQEAAVLLSGMPVCLVGSGPLLGVIVRHGDGGLAWQVWVCGDSRNSVIGSAVGVGGVGGRPIGAPAVVGAGGLPSYGGVLGMGGNNSGTRSGMTAGVSPRCAQEGFLPCRPNCPLRWAGFSAEGLLAVADAAGLVRVVSPAQGWVWVPVLDLRAEQVPCAVRPDQSPWIVGMTSSQLLFVACKHGERNPTVMPRPLLQAQALQIPLAGPRPGAATKKQVASSSPSPASSQIAGPPAWAGEAKACLKRVQVDGLRWVASMGVHLTPHLSESDAPNGDWSQVAAGSVGASTWKRTGQAILSTEKAIDKEILRLLDSCLQQRVSSAQVAAQAGLRGSVAPEERAFHLAQRLVMPRALDLAVRLATQHQRTALADRLHALRRARNREREAIAPAMPHAPGPSATEDGAQRDDPPLERPSGPSSALASPEPEGSLAHRRGMGETATMTPGGGTPAQHRTSAATGGDGGRGTATKHMQSRGLADPASPRAETASSIAEADQDEQPSTPPRAHRRYGKMDSLKRSREAMEETDEPPSMGSVTNPFLRAVQQSPAKRPARGLDQLLASSPQKMSSRAETDFTSPRRLSRQSTFFQEVNPAMVWASGGQPYMWEKSAEAAPHP